MPRETCAEAPQGSILMQVRPQIIDSSFIRPQIQASVSTWFIATVRPIPATPFSILPSRLQCMAEEDGVVVVVAHAIIILCVAVVCNNPRACMLAKHYSKLLLCRFLFGFRGIFMDGASCRARQLYILICGSVQQGGGLGTMGLPTRNDIEKSPGLGEFINHFFTPHDTQWGRRMLVRVESAAALLHETFSDY